MGLLGSLGSFAGSFFGPAGTAIGGAIGSSLDDNAADRSADGLRTSQMADSRAAQQQQNEYNIARDTQAYERQKEFAQMGIRWRTDDAKAAGLHPLAVLGASGASYSPTITAGSQYEAPAYAPRSTSNSDAFSQQMGQDLRRAEIVTKTETERKMEALTLRRMELQNALLEGQNAAQWSQLMGPISAPPAPAATGATVAPVGAIKVKPSESVSRSRSDSSREASSTPAVKNFDLGHGHSIDLPGQAMSESLESMGPMAAPIAMTVRAARNAWYGPDGGPSLPAPAGDSWYWDRFSQSFKLTSQRQPRRTTWSGPAPYIGYKK